MTLNEIFEELWDQGNAVGLDGWIGPGRGQEQVDNEAISARQRDVQRAFDQFAAALNLEMQILSEGRKP